jgi:hypothetical protein
MQMVLVVVVLGLTISFTGPVHATDGQMSSAVVASEMQSRQQRGAMTPMRARRECWQSLGFAPNLPRDRYPARLLPQVEACIAQRMRR